MPLQQRNTKVITKKSIGTTATTTNTYHHTHNHATIISIHIANGGLLLLMPICGSMGHHHLQHIIIIRLIRALLLLIRVGIFVVARIVARILIHVVVRLLAMLPMADDGQDHRQHHYHYRIIITMIIEI
jgi:hypothetical protein